MAFLPATFLAESPDVDVYAREPVQANYIASPDPDTQWRPGTQPLDTLPTQWWNYFNNLYTKQINTTNKYLKQVISEIADVVGASIDNTDSLQLKAAVTDKLDQLKDAVDALEDRVDDLDVGSTAGADVTTSTSSAGTSTHAARVDHVHKIADSAVTRAKIAASTITMDRLARVTPGNNTTTAVAIAQAYNATLANKLANAGIVSVQTSIPASATNEAAYCVPNVAAVRSFVQSSVQQTVWTYWLPTHTLSAGVITSWTLPSVPAVDARVMIWVVLYGVNLLHIDLVRLGSTNANVSLGTLMNLSTNTITGGYLFGLATLDGGFTFSLRCTVPSSVYGILAIARTALNAS